MRKHLIYALLALLALSSAAALVSAHSYNYNVTNNYHGIDAPYNSDVVVTATTNDPHVTRVTFIWKNAANQVIWTDVVPISGGSAQSTHKPNSLGDWGVQVLFQAPKCGGFETVKTRASSFNVVPGTPLHSVPEVPVLGAAGAAGAMVVGLVFVTKRKQKPTQAKN